MPARSLLTPAVHSAIIAAIDADGSLAFAAANVGVTERTLKRWLKRGRDAHAAATALIQSDDGREEAEEADIPESELPYWLLVRDVERTWASRRMRWIGSIEKHAMGFTVEKIVERPFTNAKGEPMFDPNGQPIMDRVITYEPRSNWQAAAWLLERFYPQEFAQVRKMEHTGSDGGAIEMTVDEKRDKVHDALRSLAERVNQPENAN